ncbi:MAG TPA: biotin--[acetyl-CoA-carboxylase] ligase [Vicinamibacteria bacterium]|nr:biotin--[acetyl-CoA-carboxylase] ligase [Vicinamibacteria bacterium]
MPDPAGLLRALTARGAEPPPRLEWHARLVSTNDRVKELAREGARDGVAVLADEQTGGRGREGRSWSSPPGGLYLSVLRRPGEGALGLLPLAAGLAVADAVAGEAGIAAELKWPNDVVVGGRKLAGVLSEASTGAGGLEWVVVGIGVNVAAVLPDELRATATSLEELLPAGPPAAASLAAAVIVRLRVWYDALATPAAVVQAWRRRALPWWGETVEVRTGAGTLRGRLLEVDDEGALVLSVAGGPRRVLSGEVIRARRVD